MSNQLKTMVTGSTLAAAGFQPAKQTNIPAIMRAINPTNGTAMRDSLIAGSNLMLTLFNILQKAGHGEVFHFVHVILTDGADCNSQNSLEDALKIMLIIGKAIPVKCLKIIFVGVGVQAQAEKELQALAYVGGENAQYYNVGSSQIGQIFNHIQVKLGIQKKTDIMAVQHKQVGALLVKQTVTPCLNISVKHFAVMFNLDVSGSMSGNKWSAVCASVNHFISKLGDTDLVSGLVFNNKVQLISQLKMGDELLPKPKVVPPPRLLPIQPPPSIKKRQTQGCCTGSDCSVM